MNIFVNAYKKFEGFKRRLPNLKIHLPLLVLPFTFNLENTLTLPTPLCVWMFIIKNHFYS